MRPFEIFIPSHPKDHNVLPYVIERAFAYTEASHCHLVVPDPGTVAHLKSNKITIHADEDVVSFDKKKIKHRPGWVYQQFLKLFQQVTQTDYYLCLCSDLIMNNKYPVFDGDSPVMVVARDHRNIIKRYVEFNKATIGIGHRSPWNFVSDGPLYCKSLIGEMLADNGHTRESFMNHAADVINKKCIIADAELYSSYIWAKYPGLYTAAFSKNFMNGLYNESWPIERVEKILKKNPPGTFDTISFHSWGP